MEKTKKITRSRLMLVLALVASLMLPVFAPLRVYANEIGVLIDGVSVNFQDQAPVNVDNRVLVPVRGVFEAIGFTVRWDGDTQTATLTRSDAVIIMQIGNNAFTTNGEEFQMDVPAQIIGGRTMIPIRAPLETVGYSLDWIDGNVVITSPPTPTTTPAPTPTPEAEPEPEPTPIAIPQPEVDFITLGGKEYSTALTELVLTGNEIGSINEEELEQLRHMTSLESLTLSAMDEENAIQINALGTMEFGEGNNIILIPPTFSFLKQLEGLVNFTSLTIEYFIEDYLPLLTGLTNLRSLTITGSAATDFSPLSELPNLTSLYISYGVGYYDAWFTETLVTDLSQFAGFNNLANLGLYYSPITNLSSLTGMTNLGVLILQSSRISDLTPLAGMTNLTVLLLDDNQISDLTPLAGLTNLTVMTLNANRITDLSPLAGLTNLEWLGLVSNQITDLSPLAGLTNLTDLGIEDNGNITDWSPVAHVETVYGRPASQTPSAGNQSSEDFITLGGKEYSTALTELSITSDDIANISDEELEQLQHMTSLQSLSISALAEDGSIVITTIRPTLTYLAGLTNLTSLNLEYIQVSDLSPLAGLTNLTTLVLYGPLTTDLTPLAGLTNLETLGLTYDASYYSSQFTESLVIDMAALTDLTNLSTLIISFSPIANFSLIANLTNLTSLMLASTQISDLSPLAELTNLSMLILMFNELSDLSPLAGLINLTLFASLGNPIEDWSPVDHVENVTGRP